MKNIKLHVKLVTKKKKFKILAKDTKDWWDELSKEEQENYLKEHPKSKLEITKKDSILDKLSKESSFKTSSEHDAWSESSYKDWYNSLTGEESNSLIGYKDTDFSEINGYLRKNEEEKNEEIESKIRNIDSAIEKSNLDRDLVVYHGFKMSPDKKIEDYIGRSFIKKGYTSVTTRPQVTENFAYNKSRSILIQIELLEGMKAASLNKGLAKKEGVKVPNTSESELLLPRNTKLVILHYEEVQENERPPRYIIHAIPDMIFS